LLKKGKTNIKPIHGDYQLFEPRHTSLGMKFKTQTLLTS